MSIYQYQDYKIYVNDRLKSLPKSGHGEFGRMARRLGVSSTLISQTFRSSKHLSLELAADLADYLGLDAEETEYFILLVNYQKAGSHNLREKLKDRLKRTQTTMLQLEKRMKKDVELNEEIKSIFYSGWVYSGIRNLTAIKGYNQIEKIATRLNLPLPLVKSAIEFLIENGLCAVKNGEIVIGSKRTYLGPGSPHTVRHHMNWRLRAMEKMLEPSRNANVHYTFPMSLSAAVADQIREELPSFVEKISKWVGPSESETVRCLNIDWFEY